MNVSVGETACWAAVIGGGGLSAMSFFGGTISMFKHMRKAAAPTSQSQQKTKPDLELKQVGQFAVSGDLSTPAALSVNAVIFETKKPPPKPSWQLAWAPVGMLIIAAGIRWHLADIHYTAIPLQRATTWWLGLIAGGMLFSLYWSWLNQIPEPDMGARLRRGPWSSSR